ncbi:MAG: GxxExxY protein [Flavobacteriaceae bacterium]|jgi:GxxExxY protein
MNDNNYKHAEMTEQVIKAFYKVYNVLGYGFLEKVYENALCIELKKLGFDVEKQQPIEVYYEDIIVGKYYADLIVNDIVILELKAAKNISYEHESQLVNYLKATDIEVGLLLNFGESPQVKRKVYSNGPRINLID